MHERLIVRVPLAVSRSPDAQVGYDWEVRIQREHVKISEIFSKLSGGRGISSAEAKVMYIKKVGIHARAWATHRVYGYHGGDCLGVAVFIVPFVSNPWQVRKLPMYGTTLFHVHNSRIFAAGHFFIAANSSGITFLHPITKECVDGAKMFLPLRGSLSFRFARVLQGAPHRFLLLRSAAVGIHTKALLLLVNQMRFLGGCSTGTSHRQVLSLYEAGEQHVRVACSRHGPHIHLVVTCAPVLSRVGKYRRRYTRITRC